MGGMRKTQQDAASFSLSLNYLSFKRLICGKFISFWPGFAFGAGNFAESKTLVKLECAIPKN